MKWGVRRTKEQLGYKSYNYDKSDTILPKGTAFQRITTAANNGISKGVYTSYKNSDKDLYKGVLGRLRLTYQNKVGEEPVIKELKMVAKQEVRIPSLKTRVNQFKDLYEADKEGVMSLIKEHQEKRYNRKLDDSFDPSNPKQLEKMYVKFNDALALGQGADNKQIVTRFYYELSKKGYNAVPDENDIRQSTFKAQAPIIMFNTNKTIGEMTVRDLNASEIFNAYNRSIPIKVIRDVVLPKGIGTEKLSMDSTKKASKYFEQIKKDAHALNKDYTIKNLAEDWGTNRLSSSQIRRISAKMDKGASHEEAVAKTIGFGNAVADLLLDQLNL
jgi:hypothetical protein